MEITLHERQPSAEPTLNLLYGSDPAGPRIFPGGHFQDERAVARRLAHLDGAAQGSVLRPTPASVEALLRSENAFAPLHPAQAESLVHAGRPGTVFLLTGQQPGLLGGPILWLYKAVTAAALAEKWTRRLQRPVVPIFWVAGDDSDLQECNQVELLEDVPAGLPAVLTLPFPDANRPISVCARPVDSQAFASLLDQLGRLWKPATLASIRSAHSPSGSLADAFLRMAQDWLGPRGVLFLNGGSPAIRAAARPILERAVKEWRPLQSALERGTAALKAAGIAPQVVLREGAVHAFVLKGGERQRLFAESGRDGARFYTADQPGIDLGPDLGALELSHDVFTRVLAVDSFLPVLGHVLGPAELRYFAQAAPAFLERTGDMPLVHPRMSVVAAPAAAAAEFSAQGITLSEAASLKPSALRLRLTEKAWKAHPAAVDLPAQPPPELLDGLRRAHARHFADPGPLDKLQRSLQGSWQRYLRTLGRMAYAEQAASSGGADEGGEAGLFHRLRWLGNGMGQDRHLNLYSLVDVLGWQGLEQLLAAADPAEPGIRLFTYDDPPPASTAASGPAERKTP